MVVVVGVDGSAIPRNERNPLTLVVVTIDQRVGPPSSEIINYHGAFTKFRIIIHLSLLAG